MRQLDFQSLKTKFLAAFDSVKPVRLIALVPTTWYQSRFLLRLRIDTCSRCLFAHKLY